MIFIGRCKWNELVSRLCSISDDLDMLNGQIENMMILLHEKPKRAKPKNKVNGYYSNNALNRVINYIHRQGGVVSRRKLISSHLLDGGACDYDLVLEKLEAANIIGVGSATAGGEDGEIYYKLLIEPEQAGSSLMPQNNDRASMFD